MPVMVAISKEKKVGVDVGADTDIKVIISVIIWLLLLSFIVIYVIILTIGNIVIIVDYHFHFFHCPHVYQSNHQIFHISLESTMLII